MIFGVSNVRLGCSTIRDNAALLSKNAVTNCISRSSCFSSTYLWSCKTYTSNKFPEVLKYVFCLFGITVRCNCTSTCVCPSLMKQQTLTEHSHTIRKGKILAKLVAPGYSNSQGIHPSRQLTSEPSTSPTAQTTARWTLIELLSSTWADRAGRLGPGQVATCFLTTYHVLRAWLVGQNRPTYWIRLFPFICFNYSTRF